MRGGGGYPIPGLGGGVPHLRSGWGGTPSHFLVGGYPISGLGRGVPHLRSGWGYPIPGLGGGYPISGLDCGGYPISGLDGEGGTSSQVWGGIPSQVWVGGYPISGLDGWGVPGVPPPPSMRQSSKASTCYAAGGVPLAFTQEDFLV